MKYLKHSQYMYAKSPHWIRSWPQYEAGLRMMKNRTFVGQQVAVQLACRVLNTMIGFGMPDSHRVE